MKKVILVLFILSFTSVSYSQTKADLAGVWKSTVKAGEKPDAVTFFMLNEDGTYTWGTDSLGNMINAPHPIGKWDLTLDKEIKIIPDDKADIIRYYWPTGSDNMYKFKYTDKDGQKVLDKSTDMSIFIQKMAGS